MNEVSIKDLWQSYNQRLEDTLIVHQKNTEDIGKLKVYTLLSSMKPAKIFTLIAGFIWVLPLGFILINLFLFGYDKVSPFFLYSASFQVLLTAIAIGIYIYQLNLIYQIDYSSPVVQIQEKLCRLKISTLWVTRILFLQLPAWTTFYLTENTISNGSPGLQLLQACITILFTWLALWIFCNVKYENRHKKWFRALFNGPEWTPLLKSFQLLDDIDQLKDHTKGRK